MCFSFFGGRMKPYNSTLFVAECALLCLMTGRFFLSLDTFTTTKDVIKPSSPSVGVIVRRQSPLSLFGAVGWYK